MTVIATDWIQPGPSPLVEDKLWGRSQLVIVSRSLVVTKIEVEAGGYCSLHRHVGRHNEFVIESGQMLVASHGCEDKPSRDARVVVMYGNDHAMLYAGDWHRFIAISKVRAYEIYRSCDAGKPVDMKDIERIDSGGMLDASPYVKFSPLLFFG